MKMTERAYRELRKSIIEHRIEPGQRLDIDEIGSSLGFSRAPVVDALNALRSEGLVVSKQRVGTFAAPISRTQITEVFDAREMLEHWSVPAVVNNVSNRQLDDLERMLAEAAPLLVGCDEQTFDYKRFMEIDHEFHMAIIRLAEQTLFVKWFDELTAHMQRVRHIFQGGALVRSREGQLEHVAILKAIRNRDVERVRECLLVHTARSRQTALKFMSSET